jgi:flavin reductase (DIM6/NTAB) family NADH-FMN oxidoreductase RutF
MKTLIKDFDSLDRHYRANLVNSIIGVKQASLIGTFDNRNLSNLALFSSAVHLGSNPPLVAIFSRPQIDSPKQTLNNIIENKFYTINHVNTSIIQRAHSCSFKFSPDESEFVECRLTEESVSSFKAPFVAESNASIGVRYKRHITIEENGVVMIVGEMKALFVQNNTIQENGEIDFNRSKSVGVAGNNTYYKLNQIASLKYFNSDQKDRVKQKIDKEFHQNFSETK